MTTGLALPFDPARTDWPIWAATDERAARRLNVLAPFDGAMIGQVDVAPARAVQDALFAAFSLFRAKRRWLSRPRRLAVLRGSAALVREHADVLAAGISAEGGKPLRQAREEVAQVAACADLAAARLLTAADATVPLGSVVPRGSRAGWARREPMGVVVAVTAFHQPLLQVAQQALAAVAAGCPLIVKPAEDTPLSALRMAHLLEAAGLRHGWCQVLVTEDHAATKELVNDARVARLHFSGSAEVGWALRAGLPAGTRALLQHDSVAPALLAEDADQPRALRAIAAGAFDHAGQTGTSVQRVYAPRAWARSFAEQLARIAAERRVGDPLDSATRVGPLIRAEAVERARTWVAEAAAAGAEVLTGGEPLSTRLFAPTVLFEPGPASRVATREIFAPVVAVFGFDDFEDACHRANALPFARRAAVFTASMETANRALRLLDATQVILNDHTAIADPALPEDGLRRSGLGGGGLDALIEAMSVEKLLVLNL